MSIALQAIERAIAALTYDHIEHVPTDGGEVLTDAQVPLLQRSIGQDLILVEATISVKGESLLSAIALSIDDALTALEEARQSLLKGGVCDVPVLPVKLVDVPRRSEDPRLARGNDNPGSVGGPDLLGDRL